MRGTLALILFSMMFVLMVGHLPTATADATPQCTGETDWGTSIQGCTKGVEALRQLGGEHPGSAFTFEKEKEVCSREDAGGDLCSTPHSCAGEYQSFYRVTLGAVWQGFACLTPAEVEELRINWYALALETMKTFSWPAAELEVTPSGGEVLVNGTTTFATDREGALEHARQLHGQVLTVRATPLSYRWVFGDGAETETLGAGTGAEHVYERKGEYSARVDVTYGGEYRVGNGQWVALSETLTVTGPTVALVAVEARPVLVL